MLEVVKKIPEVKDKIIAACAKIDNQYHDYDYSDFEFMIEKTMKFIGFKGELCEKIDLNGDYQGDYLYQIMEPTGYQTANVYANIWGYGSCSGCDAIYACNSLGDLYNCVLNFFQNLKLIITDNYWYKPKTTVSVQVYEDNKLIAKV